MKRRLPLALVLLALAAAGCSDAPSASPPLDLATLAAPGPYAVGERQLELVDTSRTTEANGSYAGAAERRLPTRVWYPATAPAAGAAPAADGPYPLVGYAHGYSSSNGEGAVVGGHLASHGYVVVAPTFPLSNGAAPGGPTIGDMTSQPGDLDFAMDAVASGVLGADLAASVDGGTRAIAGLSLGGGTVLIAAYHPRWRLPDVAAAVALAPFSCVFGSDFFSASVPMLMLAGDADMLVRLDSGPRRSFERAVPPVTLATLSGGNHVGFLGIDVPGPTNADAAVGCPVIGAGGGNAAGGFAALASKLEEGAGPGAVHAAGCTEGVCQEELPQTMSAERQVEITRAAALAHFEAVLRGRRDAQRWLEEQLAETNSDLTIDVRR
jgi:dienelactone hydrolase